MTIDVWMQHPTPRFLAGDILASPTRWTGGGLPADDLPLEGTIAKVLFGNYPMIGHSHAPDGIDQLGPSDAAREDYLHDNARRVFTKLGGEAL